MIYTTEFEDDQIKRKLVEEIATWGVWALHPTQSTFYDFGITHLPTGLSIGFFTEPLDDVLRLLYALPANPVGIADSPPLTLDQYENAGKLHRESPVAKEIVHILRSWGGGLPMTTPTGGERSNQLNTWNQQKNFAEETSRLIYGRLRQFGNLELTLKQRRVVEGAILNMIEHECGVASDHPSLPQVQQIVDSGQVDVTEVETWSDHDLYEWLEAWGYVWEPGDGWVTVMELGAETYEWKEERKNDCI